MTSEAGTHDVQARLKPAGSKSIATARAAEKNAEFNSSVEVANAVPKRRSGKRSDPAFRPTTVFVRKETQRKASRLLEDLDEGKDFSDLVEELVANWITKHSNS